MGNREELLQSIQPGMKLDKAFFLKIYGYEITWPGFADTAIKALENAGCSKAREYYTAAIAGYEWSYRQQIREAGKWYLKYLKECEKKGSEERRKQEIMELLERKKLLLMQKSQILTRE